MIDINKKYVTEERRPVKIYSIDGCSEYPVYGEFLGDHNWIQCSWTAEGIFYENGIKSKNSLVEVWIPKDKEPILCWDEYAVAERSIRFWDEINQCTFFPNFLRDGHKFKHYAKVENIEKWMIDIQKLLQ